MMHRQRLLAVCFLSFIVPVFAAADEPAAKEPSADAPPFGLAQRVPWTSSRVTGSPEPPRPYHVQRVFPQLTFENPVEMTTAPGDDRLYMLELRGKVFVFDNDNDVQRAELVVDLGKAIKGAGNFYGLEFHPDFQRNRYVYICYVIGADAENGSHVSRFTVSDTDPPTIDPATEKSIITWPAGGHNGGCLKFGPEGHLYLSTGDGTGPNPPDILKTGQDVSDLLSSVLRLDVDGAGENQGYVIPPDNPFVGVDGARGEIWAYGFRNPWKMNFDRKTGRLWLGDVGWELWELVYDVRRGGNYGWSAVEGPQPVYTDVDRGPSPISPPTVDHPHSEAASITGGHVYYGDRLKDLTGAYIYGDYETGKIWALRYDGERVTAHEEIADTTLKLVGFGLDQNDEFYAIGYTPGEIYRLVPNPAAQSPAEFPRTFSETGLFASVKDHTPAAGVVPYTVNAEPWADGASAERFVAIPGEGTIDTKQSPWLFPQDSVLVKTISLPQVAGDPGNRRRIETQILHFDGEAWNGYSYRWNDAQTDATLIEAAGADVPLEIRDVAEPGGRRQQTWHFPSRAECMRCHNPWSGNVLGFNVPQLNRDFAYSAATDNQLRTFAHVQLLDRDLSADENAAALADPYDHAADLNARARSYLHTNCAHCHRMHAGSSVLSKMRHDLPLDQTTMVNEKPSQGTFNIPGARVIVPGDPFRSVLWYRMSKLGRGRMPHIGSTVVDDVGTDLIHDWIASLPAEKPAAGAEPPPIDFAAGEKLPEPEQIAAAQQWLSTTIGALQTSRALRDSGINGNLRRVVIAQATTHADSQVRDLFERFVPEEERVKRLGSVIKPEQILALEGSAERGRHIFAKSAGVTCRNCHRLDNVGEQLGPDLRQTLKPQTRRQILESILEPSKKVDPKFAVYAVEDARGRVFSGLLIEKNDREIVLKDAALKETRIPAAEVESLQPQTTSVMPELLLRDMTAQEVADLLAYLAAQTSGTQ